MILLYATCEKYDKDKKFYILFNVKILYSNLKIFRFITKITSQTHAPTHTTNTEVAGAI